MLPLSRSEHKIYLFQDRIEIETVRRKSEERQVIPCSHQGDSSWNEALETLVNELKLLNLGYDRITLILSNPFFRYALIPWSVSLIKPEDEMRLARICFEKIYGDMDGWRIQIDKGAYGHTRVAAAVPENLVTSILAAFKNFRLKSIQPFLMHAFNQHRGNFTGQGFIIAMPESGKVCLASIGHLQWLGVRNVNCADSLDHTMLAKRELLARGLEQDSSVYWLNDLSDESKQSRSRMPPLNLDFLRPSTQRKKLLALALGIELLTAGYAIYQYQNLENGVSALQSTIDQKNSMTHKSHFNEPKERPEKIMAELSLAGNVIYSLSTPWGKLFDLIEQPLGKDVALLSIGPDAPSNTISITAESKDYASMMDYAQRLRSEPLVSDVHLINHQTQTSDPQKPILFSLSVVLNQSSF